jgi:hypothetical protein
MSSSDYVNAKKKLVLYNSISGRSTNNTNISNSVSNSLSENKNRYYSTREELSASNQVNRYEVCGEANDPTIFTNNSICNVKLESDGKSIYALQRY